MEVEHCLPCKAYIGYYFIILLFNSYYWMEETLDLIRYINTYTAPMDVEQQILF